MSGERPWYARGSGDAPDAAPAVSPANSKRSSGRWALDRDWRNTSWWIKGPFLVALAAFIIGAKLGAHFAFEWVKARWHL